MMMSPDDWIFDADLRDTADRVYYGLRNGDLTNDDAFDFACDLIDRFGSKQMFVHLAELSLEQASRSQLKDAVSEILARLNYVPGFMAESQFRENLEQAFSIIARDMRATNLSGEARIVIIDDNRARIEYGGSWGDGKAIAPEEAVDLESALVAVADHLQGAIADADFKIWPVCPDHGLGLHPKQVGVEAVWWCNAASGHVSSAMGHLAVSL
jgi:hypothetical protein